MEKKIKTVIEQLKTVRQEKGLSYQDIVDQCEKNGEFVSLSTVKRVFAADSENAGFRYDTTIQPIARVVLDLDDTEEAPAAEGHTLTEVESENIAMRSVLAIKDTVIDGLNQTIDTLNRAIDSKDQEIKRLESTSQAQIQSRNGSVEYLKNQVTEQRRIIFLSWGFVIFLLLLIIVALVIDKINPDIGFFWVH